MYLLNLLMNYSFLSIFHSLLKAVTTRDFLARSNDFRLSRLNTPCDLALVSLQYGLLKFFDIIAPP